MSHERTTIEPVRKSVTVGLAPLEAFELFTRDMGAWWPLERHSIAVDSLGSGVKSVRLIFEQEQSGRIYEVMTDGSQADWGRVLVWEPPHRVSFSWRPNLEPGPFTEVEVRFSPHAEGTLVELEHRGWEVFGESAGARRDSYDAGWPGVLERYRATGDRAR